MKTLEDQVRSVIESNTNPPYDKAQALRFYVEKTDMDALVGKDMEKYRVALEATGGAFGGVEPISRFHEAFHGPVDAAYAAAVVGLETETFLERVRENTGTTERWIASLEGENGSVQRDTWTSSFRDVMYALDYPQQVGEPPGRDTARCNTGWAGSYPGSEPAGCRVIEGTSQNPQCSDNRDSDGKTGTSRCRRTVASLMIDGNSVCDKSNTDKYLT